MSVYIEYVILDNFFFTYLICVLSFKVLREKPIYFRSVIASVVGTICAVFYPFIKKWWITLIFKAALFFVMCLILYIKQGKYFRHSVAFLSCTAVVGGMQFIIGYIFYGDAISALIYPIGDVPISIFFIAPLLIYFSFRRMLYNLNLHRLKQNYIYQIRLTSNGNSISTKGLIDTGNEVKADKKVVFMNSITALEWLKGEFIKVLKSHESMTIRTAAGERKIILFPARAELYLSKDEHIFIDVQVGISDIKTNGEYKVILPLNILEKE